MVDTSGGHIFADGRSRDHSNTEATGGNFRLYTQRYSLLAFYATFYCRKVTLTEIQEGVEWNWPDPGNLEETTEKEGTDLAMDGTEMARDGTEILSADQIFDSLEGVVQVRHTFHTPERIRVFSRE
jgi:hypothetical protein